MDKGSRPTFSDDAALPSAPPDATDTLGPEQPPRERPPSRAEGEAAARLLFDPTTKRMTTLTLGLVSNTASGDFAIFAPLATLNMALGELSWGEAPRASKARTFLLAAVVLRRLADLYATRVNQIRTSGNDGADITVPAWTAADTVSCYDVVEQALPTGPAEPPDAETVTALLLGAGVIATPEALQKLVSTWSDDQRAEAEIWCMNLYARGEGQDIPAVARPAFVPESVE
jgi:hypothetical protein